MLASCDPQLFRQDDELTLICYSAQQPLDQCTSTLGASPRMSGDVLIGCQPPMVPLMGHVKWLAQILEVLSISVQNRLQWQQHPFNGPLSGYTQVSWYKKGKTNLNFTEARHYEWQ